jgi:hypothetical protein
MAAAGQGDFYLFDFIASWRRSFAVGAPLEKPRLQPGCGTAEYNGNYKLAPLAAARILL